MYRNFTNEQVEWMLSEIQTYYLNERNEKISVNEAEKLLEFIRISIAPYFYQSILNDVFQIMEAQCGQLGKEIINLQNEKLNVPIKN